MSSSTTSEGSTDQYGNYQAMLSNTTDESVKVAELSNQLLKKMVFESDEDAYSSEDEANYKGKIEYASDDEQEGEVIKRRG